MFDSFHAVSRSIRVFLQFSALKSAIRIGVPFFKAFAFLAHLLPVLVYDPLQAHFLVYETEG